MLALMNALAPATHFRSFSSWPLTLLSNTVVISRSICCSLATWEAYLWRVSGVRVSIESSVCCRLPLTRSFSSCSIMLASTGGSLDWLRERKRVGGGGVSEWSMRSTD